MTWRGTTPISDRIFACLPYLLPAIEGLRFGRFLFEQFPQLQIIFIPLLPVIQLYESIPFAGLIIFFVLLFAVVRNENISHFIRFNTMQAILLDIVVLLCGLILPILGNMLGALAIEALFNTVFLGIWVAFIYAVAQSLMGRYAEIPAISDAVHMQVRS
ncbi:Tic20 family protein [Oxynema aestuarii]|jgi:uncharacterized membrane protein|uniref:Tic20 family protein n=1 Tax=Oxynema aestuarii AP17 TaxID=2064643 RepID=A0A6H1U1M4_9CYAN|nr:Tic20 family protein [Oxynema aestuarii]QIZ72762.1 hypothetical protein HCG48_20980 [Oxynema aestuarii AP17]RMH75735.1 MAG: hypothetical protein D6680_10635 [Cyanobacteria bacterium J007]